MFSTSIIYDRKKVASGDRPGTLEVRITYQRRSYYISTDLRVCEKHWAGAVVARPDADALNNRLRIIIARVNEKANEYIERRQPIDVQAIKEYVYGGTSIGGKHDRMLSWVKEQLPALNVSAGTRRHYELLVERLEKYGKLRSWSDLTVDGIYAWDAWLRSNIKAQVKKGTPERACCDGTINNYHKCLKAMLGRAKEFGIIDISPYERLRGKFRSSDDDNMEYLTEEQMRKILSIHPERGTALEAARDLFVFQMLTGMAFSDAQEFDITQYREVEGSRDTIAGQSTKKSDGGGSRDTIAGQLTKESDSGSLCDTIAGQLTKEGDGEGSRDKITGQKTKKKTEKKKQWVYVGERKKTGVQYVSVLLPPVVEVLERHGWKVPQMSNQKYNYTLKTLGAAIGIPRLHSHLARHTFATYMLSRGVKVQNVMRMMGHRRIEQTLKYAKILTKDVQEEYERVANDFNF